MTACTICPDRLLRPLLPLAFWLVVWQLAALAVGQSFILPGPAAVLGTLIQLAGVPSFWQTALLSLVRVLAGLLAGTLLGALTAALTCASRWADVLLSPAVRVIRAVPVVSFILFVLLWTRRGLVPVVVSALMVLPVVWGNVSRGIRETDPRLLEQARALRFSRPKTVRLVYLPSVRPYFLSAVVTSLGLAWKSGWPPRCSAAPPGRWARRSSRPGTIWRPPPCLPGRWLSSFCPLPWKNCSLLC